MNAFYLGEALNALRPNSAFGCGETYDSIEWYSTNSETKPTENEINVKITELKNAKPMKLLREERDRRIATSDWRVTKAKETSTNVPTAWKTYRQALRDLPANSPDATINQTTGRLENVTWPTKPS